MTCAATAGERLVVGVATPEPAPCRESGGVVAAVLGADGEAGTRVTGDVGPLGDRACGGGDASGLDIATGVALGPAVASVVG